MAFGSFHPLAKPGTSNLKLLLADLPAVLTHMQAELGDTDALWLADCLQRLVNQHSSEGDRPGVLADEWDTLHAALKFCLDRLTQSIDAMNARAGKYSRIAGDYGATCGYLELARKLRATARQSEQARKTIASQPAFPPGRVDRWREGTATPQTDQGSGGPGHSGGFVKRRQ